MGDATVKSLKQAILDLPADQRQQLAEEILPLLLTTRAGVKGIDHVLFRGRCGKCGIAIPPAVSKTPRPLAIP